MCSLQARYNEGLVTSERKFRPSMPIYNARAFRTYSFSRSSAYPLRVILSEGTKVRWQRGENLTVFFSSKEGFPIFPRFFRISNDYSGEVGDTPMTQKDLRQTWATAGHVLEVFREGGRAFFAGVLRRNVTSFLPPYPIFPTRRVEVFLFLRLYNFQTVKRNSNGGLC